MLRAVQSKQITGVDSPLDWRCQRRWCRGRRRLAAGVDSSGRDIIGCPRLQARDRTALRRARHRDGTTAIDRGGGHSKWATCTKACEYLHRSSRGSCGGSTHSRRPGMWMPHESVIASLMLGTRQIANQMYREDTSSPYPAGGVVIVSGSEDGLVPDGVVAAAVMK